MKHKWQLPILVFAIILLASSLGAPNMAMAVDFSKLRGDASKEAENSEDASTQEAAEEEEDFETAAPSINADWEFQTANRLARAGALSRSIPHYEKVLEAAPHRYVQAYFNLAEVYRHKGDCRQAVLMYGIYINMETGKANQADAKKSRDTCLQGKTSGVVSVEAAPDYATIQIDGFRASAGEKLEKLRLMSGAYTVEVLADEHNTETLKLDVADGKSIARKVSLEKQLFLGTLKVNVNKPRATIKIEPKALDSKKGSTEVLSLKTPLGAPLKLATGTYFIEVTLKDNKRWIRNVEVFRDEKTEVDVTLRPSVPDAIRTP